MLRKKESTLFKPEDYKRSVTRELEERIMDYCLLLCEYFDWKHDVALLQEEVENAYVEIKEKEYCNKFEIYNDIREMGLSRNEIHFYTILACGRTSNYDIAQRMLETNHFSSAFLNAFNRIATGKAIELDETKNLFTTYFHEKFRISGDGAVLTNRVVNINSSRRNVLLAMAYKMCIEKGVSVEKIANDMVCDYIYWMLCQNEDGISKETEGYEKICVKGQFYIVSTIGNIINVFRQPKGRQVTYRDFETMLLCAKEVNIKVAASYLQYMLDKYYIDSPYEEYDIIFNSCGKESNLEIITEEDVIVKSNVRNCTIKGHEIIDLRAIITVINSKGEKEINKIHAGYCRQCNEYFILNADYEYLSGVPLCTVYTLNKIKRLKNADTPYGKFSAQSLMNAHGYNVNENVKLTAEQRRTILVSLLKANKITQEEMLSHLDWLINTNKTKERWEQAVKKWTEDREFIANYVVNDVKNIGVRSITRYVDSEE